VVSIGRQGHTVDDHLRTIRSYIRELKIGKFVVWLAFVYLFLDTPTSFHRIRHIFVKLCCGVTTTQQGRVSDIRTRCHIDVRNRTRAKYPGIMLMPLCSGSLYPGSAAILAAGATASAQGRQALSRAGETPALPGKTGRNF
jgi:hypothetical protein